MLKIKNRKFKKNTFIKSVLLILLFLFSSGCLKDDANPADSFDSNDTINILIYLESNGDIINSPSTSSTFVSAQELYSNLSNYIILDIRDPQLFADGHISGAINIQSSDLLTKIKSIGSSDAILVSQNGQSASYYGSLLRLDGSSNVYVLKFGMAGWNTHFAGEWIEYSGSNPNNFNYFNNKFYPKNNYADLPSVTFSKSAGDLSTKIEYRIENLLSEKFEDGITGISSDASVSMNNVFRNYSKDNDSFGDQYIACYDDPSVYTAGASHDVTIPVHPPHAAQYTHYSDLKANLYLQTIPSNKNVVIYSLSGHQSAFATAYLRLLGYDVRSLLFGAIWLSPFPGSMNYPYVN